MKGEREMKQKLFVVGDVHGQITMFKELLQHWNSEEEQLVLVGDLGDRGEDPKACFELARELVEEQDAICLKGNHEDMLLNFINIPGQYAANYKMNGGMVTINSFIDTEGKAVEAYELAASLNSKVPWLKPFIKNLPLYFEWGNYIIAHAGVDLTIEDWRNTRDKDYVWIREGFYDQPNTTGKTIIFGHTVTAMLHGSNRNTEIWKTEDGKIGIDGGAVYGGTLHGIVLDADGIIDQYSIENTGFAFNDLLRKE